MTDLTKLIAKLEALPSPNLLQRKTLRLARERLAAAREDLAQCDARADEADAQRDCAEDVWL